MTKQGFGKYFYFGSLTIAIVIIIFTIQLRQKAFSLPEEEQTQVFKQLYILSIIALNFIIPTGVIVREFSIGFYIYKKMIIKIILIYFAFLLGLLLNLFVGTHNIGLITIYLAILCLFYAMIPTKKHENG